MQAWKKNKKNSVHLCFQLILKAMNHVEFEKWTSSSLPEKNKTKQNRQTLSFLSSVSFEILIGSAARANNAIVPSPLDHSWLNRRNIKNVEMWLRSLRWSIAKRYSNIQSTHLAKFRCCYCSCSLVTTTKAIVGGRDPWARPIAAPNSQTAGWNCWVSGRWSSLEQGVHRSAGRATTEATLLLSRLFLEIRWPSRDPHGSATADLLPSCTNSKQQIKSTN